MMTWRPAELIHPSLLACRTQVTAPHHIFTLGEPARLEQLQDLPGWGYVSATTLVGQLRRVRSGVPLDRFIYSLGIFGVGKAMAAALAREYGGWEPLWEDMTALAEAAGSGEAGEAGEAASARLQGVGNVGVYIEGELAAWAQAPQNREVVKALAEALTILPAEADPAKGDGPLREELVVFTGKMQITARKGMEKEARIAGAVVGNTITSKTTLLVVGDKPAGGKLAKAGALGVRVVPEAGWKGLLRSE